MAEDSTSKIEINTKQSELAKLREKVQKLETELKEQPIGRSTEEIKSLPESPSVPEQLPMVEKDIASSLVTPINFAQMDDDDDQQVADDDQQALLSTVPTDDLEAQVETLVKIALTSGISQAIDTAKNLNNPYVMDELHDTLVDHLYEQLIRMNKINKD